MKYIKNLYQKMYNYFFADEIMLRQLIESKEKLKKVIDEVEAQKIKKFNQVPDHIIREKGLH